MCLPIGTGLVSRLAIEVWSADPHDEKEDKHVGSLQLHLSSDALMLGRRHWQKLKPEGWMELTVRHVQRGQAWQDVVDGVAAELVFDNMEDTDEDNNQDNDEDNDDEEEETDNADDAGANDGSDQETHPKEGKSIVGQNGSPIVAVEDVQKYSQLYPQPCAPPRHLKHLFRLLGTTLQGQTSVELFSTPAPGKNTAEGSCSCRVPVRINRRTPLCRRNDRFWRVRTAALAPPSAGGTAIMYYHGSTAGARMDKASQHKQKARESGKTAKTSDSKVAMGAAQQATGIGILRSRLNLTSAVSR
jgi:hypothetical protein